METIGAFEAKTHLAELLNRVQRGESVTITLHGKPVAQLIPPPPTQDRNRADVIRDMLAFGKGRKLKGIKVRDMIEEGRRY